MSGRSEEKQMALNFYDQTRGHGIVEKILGGGKRAGTMSIQTDISIRHIREKDLQMWHAWLM